MQPPIPPPEPPPVSYQAQAAQGDGTGGLIPYKNGSALASYYIGLFSLLPCVGFFMGIAAVWLGIKGLQAAKENPIVKGKTHAWVGIVCGGFWIAVYGLLGVMILLGLASASR
jgi:hypothetical protein